MKTYQEKDWSVFARLGISLFCAAATGFLLALASYFIALWLIPVPGKGTYVLPVGQTIAAVIIGIASGVTVLILMTRTFVLRTITD